MVEQLCGYDSPILQKKKKKMIRYRAFVGKSLSVKLSRKQELKKKKIIWVILIFYHELLEGTSPSYPRTALA